MLSSFQCQSGTNFHLNECDSHQMQKLTLTTLGY